MTTPTQAQIEAAAKAIYDLPVNWRANKPKWENARYQYLKEAEAALTAAAQVGEPEKYKARKALKELVSLERITTIERCAQVVDERAKAFDGDAARELEAIAADIRKLKEPVPIDPNIVYPGKDPDFVFPEEQE